LPCWCLFLLSVAGLGRGTYTDAVEGEEDAVNITTLISEASHSAFVGEVQAEKQTYYVLKGPTHFLLFTFSGPKSGYFNAIEQAAVAYVQAAFAGTRSISSAEVLKRAKKPQLIVGRFDVLNILYILVALKDATMRKAKSPRRGFLFNIRKSQRGSRQTK
jgi:hypothetical protein